jgi:hypothetical protein
MALVRHSGRFSKKQASVSGSRCAASRKSMAAKKAKSGAKSPTAKSHTRGGRSSAKFSSLKSRQMTVESLKRLIWASLHRITDALIVAASTGNLATAKELFHFAGVYSLPTPEENAAAAPAPAATEEAAAPSAEPGMVHPIDLFFKKIGVEPSTREPEAEVA